MARILKCGGEKAVAARALRVALYSAACLGQRETNEKVSHREWKSFGPRGAIKFDGFEFVG